MNMHHLSNKQEFYFYSRKLLLGNILTQWSFEEFEQLFLNTPEKLPKIVGVRHVRKAFTNKGNSGLMKRQQAYDYAKQTPDKENLLFDEGAVHHQLTIQGEVTATERGLYVRYSHLQCHQRTLWYIDQFGVTGLSGHQLPCNPEILTLQERTSGGVVKHAFGLQASHLLRHYMDPSSWEGVNEILSGQEGLYNSFGEEFPNFRRPVIEFACFSKEIGVLKRNSLVWEVRTLY